MAILDSTRLRFRSFLTFLRPKLLHSNVDGARTVQMRRIADLRVKEAAVKKPSLTAEDVGRLLTADANRKTFPALAVEEKLVPPEGVAVPMAPQSEETGYAIELCILAQVLPESSLRTFLREFVAANMPAAPAPAAAAKESLATPPPLPEKIKTLLGEAKELWAIPATTVALLRKLSEPEPKIDEIVRDIRKDPGMSAQVLRIANSAYYAMPRKIASIHRAVITLGLVTMKRLVTSASTSLGSILPKTSRLPPPEPSSSSRNCGTRA